MIICSIRLLNIFLPLLCFYIYFTTQAIKTLFLSTTGSRFSIPLFIDLKMILKVLFLICFKLANPKDVKNMSVEELVKLGQDIGQPRYGVLKTDLKYFFYTRSTSSTIPPEEANNLRSIKVIIHGWLENHQSSWYDEITKEYLIKDDFLIIQFDWEKVARSSYISSAANTKAVGLYLGQFLLEQKYPPESVHLVGHSLGAHVAAFAANVIESGAKRIHRITGLDPAGPYFRELFIQKTERLSREDADIVDVIHTDSGFYGYEKPIGTLDLYVNGGSRVQPGCLENPTIASIGEIIATTFCSHTRSYKYFIESINKGKFVCRKCDSLAEASTQHCHGELYSLSAENILENITGIVSTKTNAKEPFLN